MKTIGINTEIKGKIREIGDENESVNDILKRLLANKEMIQQPSDDKPRRCNIHISEEVFDELNELKAPSESYGSVILRLLNSKE